MRSVLLTGSVWILLLLLVPPLLWWLRALRQPCICMHTIVNWKLLTKCAKQSKSPLHWGALLQAKNIKPKVFVTENPHSQPSRTHIMYTPHLSAAVHCQTHQSLRRKMIIRAKTSANTHISCWQLPLSTTKTWPAVSKTQIIQDLYQIIALFTHSPSYLT